MSKRTFSARAAALDDSSLSGSIAFWLGLLIAGGCYAVVALAPKFSDWLELKQTVREQSQQLAQLQAETSHLQKVATALRDDRFFARERLRTRYLMAKPDGEAIRTPNALSLSMKAPTAPSAAEEMTTPWYTSAVAWLAHDGRTRECLLLLAAGIVVISFTFFGRRQA